MVSVHICKNNLLGVYSVSGPVKAPKKMLAHCVPPCVHVCLFGCVWLFATPWTVANQALLFMGFFQARILELVAMLSSRDLPDSGIEPMSPELQVDLFHCDIWEAHYLIISFKSLHQPWGAVTIISLTGEAIKAQRSFLKLSCLKTIIDTEHNIRKTSFHAAWMVSFGLLTSISFDMTARIHTVRTPVSSVDRYLSKAIHTAPWRDLWLLF